MRSIGRSLVMALALCVASGCKSSGGDEKASASTSPAATVDKKQEKKPAESERSVSIEKSSFGQVDGKDVERYTLKNANGLTLDVITYGAIVTRFLVPDKDGKLGDVVLGFDDLKGYLDGNPYFGATVGRVANRIGNAKFELEGKTYELAANNAPHHLHGGKKGWDKVVWSAEAIQTPKGPSLRLSYTSPDGEEGYPGTVKATTVYTLTNDDAFEVEMTATTDAKTLVNMAHHSYWNLAGHDSGTIEKHELQLHASKYTPAVGLVPDGRIEPVAGTPFDFTKAKPIGEDLKAAGGDPVGFDHNWVVDGKSDQMRPVATLKDPSSGRSMIVRANQPGVQFYSGNFLDGSTKGKGGTSYVQYAALCLETQKFPNSVNVPDWKSEVVLEPGKTYRHVMTHQFAAQ